MPSLARPGPAISLRSSPRFVQDEMTQCKYLIAVIALFGEM